MVDNAIILFYNYFTLVYQPLTNEGGDLFDCAGKCKIGRKNLLTLTG